MEFKTRVVGIPCICEVLDFSQGKPMRVYGPAMEDAEPPEEGSFNYRILDSKGRHAPWLESKITPMVEAQLYEEAAICFQYEADNYDVGCEFDPRYEMALENMDYAEVSYGRTV